MFSDIEIQNFKFLEFLRKLFQMKIIISLFKTFKILKNKKYTFVKKKYESSYDDESYQNFFDCVSINYSKEFRKVCFPK